MPVDSTLTRYAWLAIGTALVTLAIKWAAWWLTGSVGLLSDALEAFINLGAGLLALWMLRIAASPPDDKHPYGLSNSAPRSPSSVPGARTRASPSRPMGSI